MGDEFFETKTFAALEQIEELSKSQKILLSQDWRDVPSPEEDKAEENVLSRVFVYILAQYQEQPYLFDPYLEGLVTPVVDWLKVYARESVQAGNPGSNARVNRVARALYNYVKFRGYKTIIRFFPHEVADLALVLNYINSPDSFIHDDNQWALRFIVLLWVSLICMLPFDLAQFDPPTERGKTSMQIQKIGMAYLGKAGVEREGSALLLSRLYMRRDTSANFNEFIETAARNLSKFTPFEIIGTLHVLCEVVKSAPIETVQMRIPALADVVNQVEALPQLSFNTLIRKFNVKLLSRIALRTLPGVRIGRTVRSLDPAAAISVEAQDTAEDDVSETVEFALERLFTSLQDRDTIVRWSAAKGVARIAERLPADFVDQVIGTILDLFSIHSIAAASMYQLPAIAEATWHGASLACAELSRRGLVQSTRLSVMIEWMLKALYFDLRKGAHSIGSNVRDAAAYTVWALARLHDVSTLAPHAHTLSQTLVNVAVFDREVQIRRAASAAFQEHVGRTSHFPHGIDVLRKTDFYAVSIRRNSFLVAAPQVAEHEFYRQALLDHVLNVTLRHWDPAMRRIGAESIRHICLLDLGTLAPRVHAKVIPLLESIDVTDIHGGLLALSELGLAFRSTLNGASLERELHTLFGSLSKIPHDTLVTSRNGIVTGEACRVVSITVTLSEIEAVHGSSVPKWEQLVDFGIKHRTGEVQEEGAKALGTVSSLVNCEKTVLRLIKELSGGSPFAQQSLGTVLGYLAYGAHSNALQEAIAQVLDCLDSSTTTMKNNVEGRRNCFIAIPKILASVIHSLPNFISPENTVKLFDALLLGLSDYTIDERGDVGSWIRIACVNGLATCIELLISHAKILSEFEKYLPSSKYHAAIGGILKQGVEKLDNVRFEAGRCFLRLLRLSPPDVSHPTHWTVSHSSMFKILLPSINEEVIGWNDGPWLFPKVVQLLKVDHYRQDLLEGLVLSLGSKTDVTQRNVSESLSQYVEHLPVESETEYNLVEFVGDLLRLTDGKLGSNAVVIPVLQTLNVLLSSGALVNCDKCVSGQSLLTSVLRLASRGVERLKSVQRINECSKIVIHLLVFASLYESCATAIRSFLVHKFPVVRSSTAENLYLLLQSADLGRDTDGVEEILLQTEWTNNAHDMFEAAASSVVDLLLSTEQE
ncbi:TBCD protein [Flagelloscypha sp. PMI_526]|nr:TBCD protein [Flagelloscypha sp. PMI_526]